jgi:hypothetical protein
MDAIRSGVKWLWGAILVAFLAVGIPLAWVWVGSQVQGGTSPTGTAIVTVIVGLTMSYAIVALIAAWLKGRVGGETTRYRFMWNRSMRDERYTPASTTFLENVLIVATIVVALIIVVWFFAFGNPGVPVTP